MADTLSRPSATGDSQAVRRVVSAAFHPGNEAALVERIRASDQYVAAMELVAVDGDPSDVRLRGRVTSPPAFDGFS